MPDGTRTTRPELEIPNVDFAASRVYTRRAILDAFGVDFCASVSTRRRGCRRPARHEVQEDPAVPPRLACRHHARKANLAGAFVRLSRREREARKTRARRVLAAIDLLEEAPHG